jgi:hypothetical protein
MRRRGIVGERWGVVVLAALGRDVAIVHQGSERIFGLVFKASNEHFAPVSANETLTLQGH